MQKWMYRASTRRLGATHSILIAIASIVLSGQTARAECPLPELTSGLHFPLGITQTDQGNLLVSETGTLLANTGRISIVDLDGNRRTLLDGLPSGINDVNEPSGPAGLFMRGRALYVAIGIGDTILAGPVPGTNLPNSSPSSPIFSSVLAIHFNAKVEKTTAGFALTFADQQSLASGEQVTKTNSEGEQILIELLANFPDYTPNPLPFLTTNVRGVNPFNLVVVANQVYVTDGAQNLLWQLNIPTRAFSILTAFSDISNPVFPSFGGPFIEAVPAGLRYSDGQLLVTLFRGFPFLVGSSEVRAVDPKTGVQTSFISGLTTAIDVLPVREGDDTHYFVLQHVSAFTLPPFESPWWLLHFETPADPPTITVGCLTKPSSMTVDNEAGTLYLTELVGGRIVAIPIAP